MLLQFFRETLGLDMTMKPDYDTFECKLRYFCHILHTASLRMCTALTHATRVMRMLR
jgi:Beta-carotene isomerase D27-like, C-terminal